MRELDALVLAAAGSSDARANADVARLARLWGHRHHLPTSVAFASTAPPSTGEAVRDWRRQGTRYVAVGSLFIAPGKLPDRAEELALEAGAVAVSAPLGAHEELSRVILARYSVGALQLVQLQPDLPERAEPIRAARIVSWLAARRAFCSSTSKSAAGYCGSIARSCSSRIDGDRPVGRTTCGRPG